MILTAGNLADLGQILLHYLGHGVVVAVAGLAVGEEGLRILCGTAGHRTLGSEGTVAETLDVGLVDQWEDILVVETLDLVILVRGAETIEEVDEGHAGLQ